MPAPQVAKFFPQSVYGTPDGITPPRVLIAPPKYIQGPGVLNNAGKYLSVLQIKRAAILASARGHSAQAGELAVGLEGSGIAGVPTTFAGECSIGAIEQHTTELADENVDCLIAVGGGKCVDAGKCIAYRLGVPVVIVPTLASNDAPCSALSVLYTDAGVMAGAEFFPQNPSAVIVDTTVVAAAPERYLAAGMGDAMATWYEARVCMANEHGRTVLGTRPTLAACALGELCAHTLFEQGVAGNTAVRNNEVDDALEAIVEANTLLSGIGFESGGLAAAHGYAQGYTTVAQVEHNYLHGEMVAMGVLAQLMLQQDPTEARRVAGFFAQVGLPIHLGQLGLAADQKDALTSITDSTATFAGLANFPFEVTKAALHAAILQADELGREVAATVGDTAYRRLHS